ncbi:hypothetical protein [Gluconacetobacter diazotrophicus]|nr:hypothetical protein [Gluconacetobacter diazotrophicus]
MTIFHDTAKALKMAPEDRQRVWAALETMALSPDDPEVVRLLVTEFTRTTLNALSANLEQATTRALNAFETAQSQAEATAQARLAARQAELAQTLTRSIADSLEQTLERQTRAKEKNVAITQWIIGPVLVLFGVWLAKTWEGWSVGSDGNFSEGLCSYSPWALLGAGTMLFVTLRLIIGWTIGSRLFRALLVLPPLEDVRARSESSSTVTMPCCPSCEHSDRGDQCPCG